MNKSIVTIGMPVYNCERTVAEAIASILNQTFKDWELIVFDDGSLDRTLAVARQFGDPRIRVVEGGRNVGLPACLNQIIASCKGTYFARMDGDDIAYPNRLQDQYDFLQSHSDIDLIAGSILVFRSDGIALGVRRSVATHEQICAHPWSGIPMAHPTWMGRIRWFRSHPYNINMVRMEDWELLFRTYRYSRFANLPQIVVGYREDSLSLRKILVARRNRCTVLLHSEWEGGTSLRIASAIAGQVVRSLFDIAAIGLRLNYRLLTHRALPVFADEHRAWQDVFNRTRETKVENTMPRQKVSA